MVGAMRIFLAVIVAGVAAGSAIAADAPTNALTLHGQPAYPPSFTHFAYVRPDAPKGGVVRLAELGTFDNLNPHILKGIAAPGSDLVFETLMKRAEDEPFSQYGYIAETVRVHEGYAGVTYTLRPEARWHDGSRITAADVVFSFKTLTEKGHPSYRAYYSHVKDVRADSDSQVTFTFDMKGNRELPLIVGEMPVISRAYWKDKAFEKTTQTPPMGSGPYKVESFDPGRRITYTRVKNWWAQNLPVNKGMYNFDTVVYDMYRDQTVLVQAFFAGAYDIRAENIAKAWEVEYDQPPVRNGLIVKREIKHSLPVGMQAFVFNIRRDKFKDIRVRKAINYAFDFEWSNKQIAFGKYKRNASYFENADLAGHQLPDAAELKILEPFKKDLPPEVFTDVFENPKTSGDGTDLRRNLKAARDLLTEAGYMMNKNGRLEKDGVPLTFEFLLYTPAFERWVNPFILNLKKLGIEATLRTIDMAQYQNRLNDFDFDIVVHSFPQSLSPGNEQRDFFGSDKADQPGSRNMIGIKNPVIDRLIEGLVKAETREDLRAYTRAIDRVLLWNYYLIPQWYIDYHRIAYWDKFGRPETAPKYGLGVPETWWYDSAKAVSIEAKIKPETAR